MLHPTPPTVFSRTCMRCPAYKSRTRVDSLVYRAEPGGLATLRAALRSFPGMLEHTRAFDRNPQRHLARGETIRVLAGLCPYHDSPQRSLRRGGSQ